VQCQFRGVGTRHIPDVILKSLYLTFYQSSNIGGQSLACNLFKHILGQLLSPKDIGIMKLKVSQCSNCCSSQHADKRAERWYYDKSDIVLWV